MDNAKKVLTPQEIAEELHVLLRLVYRQLHNGTIPHVKLGDKYLIQREAFERWLSGQSTPAE